MPQYTVYTIGHGMMDWDAFNRLLTPHRPELLVDVRSFPFSDGAPWFNRDRIEQNARRCGFEYIWLGSNLGALTEDGRVDNIAREHEPRYREGIGQLLNLAAERTVCLVGSQPNPYSSHRHSLISQTLIKHDVEVLHILENGGVAAAQADLFHYSR